MPLRHSQHCRRSRTNTMQFHRLQPRTRLRKGQRIGRGGKRGTTSGRGTKGQKARAGAKIRPALRDIIKKLPKLRGRGKHTFRSFRPKAAIVNIYDLDTHFASGETVDRAALIRKGLVRTIGGRTPLVKVLGGGDTKKRLILKGLLVSQSVRVKIEGAGGSVK